MRPRSPRNCGTCTTLRTSMTRKRSCSISNRCPTAFSSSRPTRKGALLSCTSIEASYFFSSLFCSGFFSSGFFSSGFFSSGFFSSAFFGSGLASSGFFSAGAGKTSALLATFQRRTPWPWVPTASSAPSGEKATDQQVLPWGPSEAVSFFSFTSQRRTVRSWLQLASTFPSGEKVTSLTQSLWPSSVACSLPSLFQSLILRSAPAVASEPSLAQATDQTASACPSSLAFSAGVSAFQSQSFASLSVEQVASTAPSGENATS